MPSPARVAAALEGEWTMKENKDDRPATARRAFLKLSTLGVAAAGAAAALAPTKPAAAAAEPAGTGYRETAHVRTYYETARF